VLFVWIHTRIPLEYEVKRESGYLAVFGIVPGSMILRFGNNPISPGFRWLILEDIELQTPSHAEDCKKIPTHMGRSDHGHTYVTMLCIQRAKRPTVLPGTMSLVNFQCNLPELFPVDFATTPSTSWRRASMYYVVNSALRSISIELLGGGKAFL